MHIDLYSIEMLNLDLNGSVWIDISVPLFSEKSWPVVCPFNEKQILICGGEAAYLSRRVVDV